jgi:hypothetical protein
MVDWFQKTMKTRIRETLWAIAGQRFCSVFNFDLAT